MVSEYPHTKTVFRIAKRLEGGCCLWIPASVCIADYAFRRARPTR